MTKPTHPVELIVCAIRTQENNPLTNPGNLRYAGQIGATCPRCGATGGNVPAECYIGPAEPELPYHAIAVFVTRKQGIAALFRQVWEQVADGQTLTQIIAQWAPPSENNTSVYLQNVRGWTGLAVTVPILALLPDPMALNGSAT